MQRHRHELMLTASKTPVPPAEVDGMAAKASGSLPLGRTAVAEVPATGSSAGGSAGFFGAFFPRLAGLFFGVCDESACKWLINS